jgi:hypothetical protein
MVLFTIHKTNKMFFTLADLGVCSMHSHSVFQQKSSCEMKREDNACIILVNQ